KPVCKLQRIGPGDRPASFIDSYQPQNRLASRGVRVSSNHSCSRANLRPLTLQFDAGILDMVLGDGSVDELDDPYFDLSLGHHSSFVGPHLLDSPNPWGHPAL